MRETLMLLSYKNHPYKKYENTKQWRVLRKALSGLQKNRDIEITTAPELVIGYLCQELSRSLKRKDKIN